tara:strand:- start:12 stop:380 length:369 start_codon:yes stop_codon:yes gene_type:complete
MHLLSAGNFLIFSQKAFLADAKATYRLLTCIFGLLCSPVWPEQKFQSNRLIGVVAASAMRESYVAMVCSRGVPKIAGSRDPRDCQHHLHHLGARWVAGSSLLRHMQVQKTHRAKQCRRTEQF